MISSSLSAWGQRQNAVLGAAAKGIQLPTMEVWRSPICVSRSQMYEHSGYISAKRNELTCHLLRLEVYMSPTSQALASSNQM